MQLFYQANLFQALLANKRQTQRQLILKKNMSVVSLKAGYSLSLDIPHNIFSNLFQIEISG